MSTRKQAIMLYAEPKVAKYLDSLKKGTMSMTINSLIMNHVDPKYPIIEIFSEQEEVNKE